MQNIINFLIVLSIPIAAAMFAFAGFLYVTGASNPTKIAQAHKIFKNVLIGFLIAISAWLVVQTILNAVFDKEGFFESGGDWFTLSCVKKTTDTPGQEGRLIGTNFGDLISEVFPSKSDTPADNVGGGTIDTSGTVSNPLFNSNVNVKQGASVVGLQQGTIDYINGVPSKCGCSFVITEGTGGTHVDGTFDHAAGYKLDVRSQGNSTLNTWVQSSGTAGSWSDGTPTYTMENVIWALEDRGTSNEHWDVQVLPQ